MDPVLLGVLNLNRLQLQTTIQREKQLFDLAQTLSRCCLSLGTVARCLAHLIVWGYSQIAHRLADMRDSHA